MRTLRVLAWPAHKFSEFNPYTSLLYRDVERLGVEVEDFSIARLLTGRYDVWHIHWPEHFLNKGNSLEVYFKTSAFPVLMDVAHTLNIRILWTAHNLDAHECLRPGLENFFWRQFTRRLDGFISLSRYGVELVLDRYPSLRAVPAFVIPHGHYCAEYPTVYTRSEARKILSLDGDGPVVLYFGAIRDYKSVPELEQTFHQVPNPSARLIVAGRCPFKMLESRIRENAAKDPRIRLFLQTIPPNEVQLYFAASDVVVLPYKALLNSGTALLAVSLSRPVYVPALGSMGELREILGDDWVRTYPGEFGPAVLQDAIEWSQDIRPEQACLKEFDWDNIGAATVSAYRALTAGTAALQVSPT